MKLEKTKLILENEINTNSQHIRQLKEQPRINQIALLALQDDNHINIQAYKDLLSGDSVEEAIERAELIKSRRQ